MSIKNIYDLYKKRKTPSLFLANPQKNYVGLLSNVKNLSFDLNCDTLDEFRFTIYKFNDGVENEFYDKVVEKRLIEVRFVAWFQIQNIKEMNDGKNPYKEVLCYSLENQLIGKRIYDVNGVYALYDVTDTENSLLHIITKDTGWGIGHVDNELIGKWRTFSVDTHQVYNFLMQDVSKSFQCAFQFNTYDKTINAYTMANLGNLTDITVSRKNILKEYIQECNADQIVTKLKVVGAEGIDIRPVNPTGANYLINLDYFLTPDWMTQSTIDAFNLYKSKYDNQIEQHTATLSLYKQYQTEITTLETNLKDLEGALSAKEQVRGTYIQMYSGAPSSSSPEYSLYEAILDDIDSLQGQIKTKKSEIVEKKSLMVAVRDSLDLLSVDLSISNNFTSEQLAEINEFLTENEEYSDPTFVVTDIMSDDEVTEVLMELMQNASNELFKKSQPQYTLTITAENLFTISNHRDNEISYEDWLDNFQVNNLITVFIRDNYPTTPRLMSMKLDFDNPKDIDLVFSNKDRLDDNFTLLNEELANAGRTANTLSLNKIGYDQASKQRSEVREFMNSSFNATLNRIKSDDNIQTELGEFGIINRKYLPDEDRYSDYQSWFTQNVLLFTSDNWKSTQTGIGLFETEEGEKYFGVLAPVIVGEMMLTSALKIMNVNNSISLDKDGAKFIDCDITIEKGDNTLYLNAQDGIKLEKDDIPQFYIDGNGNATFKGYVSVTNGKNTININSESGFEILKGTDKVIYLDTDGNAIFKGHVEAESGTIAGFDIVPMDEDNNGGLIYADKETGKYIRISPYSYHEGGGIYNTDYGAIDLGNIDSNGVVKTLATLRGNGYVRFGLVSEGGVSVRFNDFLRYNEGVFGATDTVMYTQNFWIDTDGTVHIKSDDIAKPISIIEKTIDGNNCITKLDITYKDDTTATIDIEYDVNGEITKIGDTIIM